jgi:catabolite repression HPr-like protein
MIQKSMQIQLANGLEARPVAVLVQKASMFDSEIYIEAEGKKVNAKSIMGMMSLGLNMGEEVTIIANGADEADAVKSLENYISGNEKE